jgi:hypothetical protein
LYELSKPVVQNNAGAHRDKQAPNNTRTGTKRTETEEKKHNSQVKKDREVFRIAMVNVIMCVLFPSVRAILTAMKAKSIQQRNDVGTGRE